MKEATVIILIIIIIIIIINTINIIIKIYYIIIIIDMLVDKPEVILVRVMSIKQYVPVRPTPSLTGEHKNDREETLMSGCGLPAMDQQWKIWLCLGKINLPKAK